MGHSIYDGFKNGPFAELWQFHPMGFLRGCDGLVSLQEAHCLLDLLIQRTTNLLGIGLVIGVLP